VQNFRVIGIPIPLRSQESGDVFSAFDRHELNKPLADVLAAKDVDIVFLGRLSKSTMTSMVRVWVSDASRSGRSGSTTMTGISGLAARFVIKDYKLRNERNELRSKLG